MQRITRRLVVAALVLGAAGGGLLEHRARYHDGPVSDHFDGTRFYNPEFPIGKGLLDVLRWAMVREPAEWPDAVPFAATARPPARVTGADLHVTWVGHATVLVQTAGLNILTDPVWSERAFMVPWAEPKRVSPPGIAFADLPPIDVVLVTHNHYDHMDLPTLVRLQREHDPLFVMPLGNDAHVRDDAPAMRLAMLDWWQSVAVGAVRVHVVPVYHWSRRRATDRNKALWGGFVLEAPGGSVYVAGDTGMGSGEFFTQAAARFGAFRLALLPVGAYEPRWFMKDQHVNPAEAVRIHRLLNARTTIGVHLRTFQLTDEGIEQPEIELAAALREQQVSSARFFTLPIGGRWTDGAGPQRKRTDEGPVRAGVTPAAAAPRSRRR